MRWYFSAVLLLALACLVVAQFESTSNSDVDSWSMAGRYLNNTGYTHANFPSNVSLTNVTSVDIGSGGPSTPLLILNESLYVGGTDSKIHQLNASNASHEFATFSAGLFIASALLYNGSFYAGSDDNRIYQLNASNVSHQIANFTGIRSARSNGAVRGAFLYIGGGAEVYRLNATNVSHQLDNFSTSADIEGGVSVNEQYVYTTNRNGRIYQLNVSNVSQLIALNEGLGAEVSYATPVIYEDSVYVGSDSNNLYQFNASNVSQLFNRFDTSQDITASVAAAHGYIYMGSHDNILYQLNASNISVQHANLTVGGDIDNQPMVNDHYVVIHSDDGKLWQVNASNVSQVIGTRLLKTNTGSQITSPIAANGRLYVADDSYNIHIVGDLAPINDTPQDTTPPNVTNLNVTQPGGPNQGGMVNITVNITSNATTNLDVSQVLANITFPNASNAILTMTNDSNGGQTYNVSFNTTLRDTAGLWNVTIYANDTKNNINHTEYAEFTVRDIFFPNVTGLNMTQPEGTLAGSRVNISVNVTDNGFADNLQVDQVLVNITYPNASSDVFTMTNGSGNTYNFTFNLSSFHLGGLHNVTILANDSFDNLNNTLKTNFTVTAIPDTTPSNVTLLSIDQPSGTGHNGLVNITVNITDNKADAVETVLAQITPPNGTANSYNLTMTNGSNGGMTFNVSFILTDIDADGNYTVLIIANDTNDNINNTISAQFRVAITPSVNFTSVLQPNGTVVGGLVNLSVNVTDNQRADNHHVDVVLANITPPNGSASAYTLTMTNGSEGGNRYNVTFIIPNTDRDGNYTVTFLANDTGGNLNSTISTSFVLATVPNVTVANVTLPEGGQAGATINITVNVTDQASATNNFVDVVRVNLTYPNASSDVFTMTNVSNTYNYTFNLTTFQTHGLHNITILANDTAGNLNNSIRANFTVSAILDIVVPNVTINSPQDRPYLSRNVTFNVSLNENGSVRFSVDGGATNLSMDGTLNGEFGTSFNYSYVNLADGSYTFLAYANDTSDNQNFTVNVSFTVNASDRDNDGVLDINDTVEGNISNVSLIGVTDLNITIGGNTTQGNYTGLWHTAFYDGDVLIMNFTHNYTARELDLKRIRLEKTTTSLLVNTSGQVLSEFNKTIWMDDNEFVTLCLKDEELASVDDISPGCAGSNETDFTSCLGQGGGTTIDGKTCYDQGARLRIENVGNTAARGTTGGSSGGTTGGGGGGGGGYYSYRKECDDRRDNDGDGLVDLRDPDCNGRDDDSEQGPLFNKSQITYSTPNGTPSPLAPLLEQTPNPPQPYEQIQTASEVVALSRGQSLLGDAIKNVRAPKNFSWITVLVLLAIGVFMYKKVSPPKHPPLNKTNAHSRHKR